MKEKSCWFWTIAHATFPLLQLNITWQWASLYSSARFSQASAIKQNFLRTIENSLQRRSWHNDTWMTNNPGRRVTDYEVTSLFNAAYLRSASLQKSVSGFKTTGIWPFNPDIFTNEDFAPAVVTEINEYEISAAVNQDRNTTYSGQNPWYIFERSTPDAWCSSCWCSRRCVTDAFKRQWYWALTTLCSTDSANVRLAESDLSQSLHETNVALRMPAKQKTSKYV